MRTFEEITAEYVSEYKEQKNRRKATNEQADKAKAAAMRYYRIAARKMGDYNKLKNKANGCYVSWINKLVVPLVEEVNQRTGLDFDCSNLRSFGIGCECPVLTKSEERHASLTFTPGFGSIDDPVKLRLYTGETTNRYPQGSIGELNGGNNIEEDVVSVEAVIENIRRRYPELNI